MGITRFTYKPKLIFMEQIFNQLIQSFDFTLMLIINVITFAIIKFIDEHNGDKLPSTWQKRLVFLAVAVVLGIVYAIIGETKIVTIINSCIVAPIAWSWIFKPLFNKMGLDYKKK